MHACVRAGSIWEISVSPSQFCGKPKNAPKNSLFLKSYYIKINNTEIIFRMHFEYRIKFL